MTRPTSPPPAPPIRVPILTYHKLGRPTRGTRLKGMYTAPEAFERQLRFLARRGFRTCDFHDLARARRGEAELPPRPVLLTFDDGHLDNHTLGLPILRAHGARASVFVVARDVGRRGVRWPAARHSEAADLFDWDQARELAAHGVRIEVHGWEHGSMARAAAADPEGLRADLLRARERVQAELGSAPVALAYPFGDWSAEAAGCARAAGFTFACTTRRGIANPERDDPFALPRIPVRGYRWVHQARFRLAFLELGLGARRDGREGSGA